MIEFDEKLKVFPKGWANDRVHFFKYMSTATAKIVIGNRTLRWSTTSAMNDPWEMQFNPLIQGDKAHIKQIALEQLWQLYESNEPVNAANPVGVAFEFIRKNVRGMSKDELFNHFGPGIDEGMAVIEKNADANSAEIAPMFATTKILSLTVRPDIRLMWAHYADSHKGVVLRLRSIPGLDSPYGMAKPIIYTDVIPPLFTDDYLINSFCGIGTVQIREVTDRIIFRKAPEWAYEQEWRISTGNGRNANAPFDDSAFGWNELDGIIFGLKTSDADKTEIRQLASAYPNVELMQAAAIPNQGELDINVID